MDGLKFEDIVVGFDRSAERSSSRGKGSKNRIGLSIAELCGLLVSGMFDIDCS